MKTRSLLIAAAVALSPVAAAAQPTPVYLRDAGAGDLFEKQSSTAVLQTTRNPAIRRFAQMMIRDHTNSTNMVKVAARQSRVAVGTPHLNPAQLRMMAELRRARGAERDRLYLEQQRTSHDTSLQVQQDYASTGAATPLRRAAGRIVPVVQQHISMLQGMDAAAPMAGHRM